MPIFDLVMCSFGMPHTNKAPLFLLACGDHISFSDFISQKESIYSKHLIKSLLFKFTYKDKAK